MKIPENEQKFSFLYRNSLSIVFLTLGIIFLCGQAVTGWHEYNQHLQEELHLPEIGFSNYLTSGHFLQATFENWESEFLQMALFILFTIFLRQIGSSESKGFDGEEEVDKEPSAHEDAPGPVKKGGFALKIYKYSLTLVMLLLFIACFAIHLHGSLKDYNLEQLANGKNTVSAGKYITESRFWFESFQNWQSEFISIAAIVFLSVYLRQKGSPQSKPVDAPHYKTGE
ncbi:MAG TPA: DUF6766 family protein [Bacteroidia bacterium]|nr:DUF6766 family protein [Bacteroidia bacterium]